MINITAEQILEFFHAEEVWVWNDDPHKAVNGKPFRLYLDGSDPFEIIDDKDDLYVHKNFSLTKPQVYEDGKWYTAKTFQEDFDICCHYNSQLNLFICDGIRYPASGLTNIRPISEEMWEGGMTKDELIKLAEIANVRVYEFYGNLFCFQNKSIFPNLWKPHEDLNQLREVWKGLGERQEFKIVASAGYVFYHPKSLCKLILEAVNEN